MKLLLHYLFILHILDRSLNYGKGSRSSYIIYTFNYNIIFFYVYIGCVHTWITNYWLYNLYYELYIFFLISTALWLPTPLLLYRSHRAFVVGIGFRCGVPWQTYFRYGVCVTLSLPGLSSRCYTTMRLRWAEFCSQERRWAGVTTSIKVHPQRVCWVLGQRLR